MLHCFKAIMGSSVKVYTRVGEISHPPHQGPIGCLLPSGSLENISSHPRKLESVLLASITIPSSFLFTFHSLLSCVYEFASLFIFHFPTPRWRGRRGQETCSFIPLSSMHSKHRKNHHRIHEWMNQWVNKLDKMMIIRHLILCFLLESSTFPYLFPPLSPTPHNYPIASFIF